MNWKPLFTKATEMGKSKKANSLNGFTIIELLVTLALTSIAITLSYTTLNYVQKLFYNYREQNKFINEYTSFKKMMDFESIGAQMILDEGNDTFTIKRDSILGSLQFLDKVILLKRAEHCDTFHISVKKLEKEYELMANPQWTNRLIKKLQFETEFTRQKFIFYFYKNYDASLKLELEKPE